MRNPKIPTAAARLARAREEVELAESELDSALREIEILPREQKRAVTQAVTDAFQKLRDVRLVLSQLEQQVAQVPSMDPIGDPETDT